MIERADELRLIAELRAGGETRERALGALFELTRTSLYSVALRMTGRPDLADDAVQETFVDVLRGIEGFRDEARLTTWLYRVAVRAAARVAARARNRHAALPEELPDVSASAREPAESLARREGAARILAAIAQLPPPQRAVVALAAVEDLPQVEIAAVLGIPAGTVYSRLHQARERLRELLARGRA